MYQLHQLVCIVMACTGTVHEPSFDVPLVNVTVVSGQSIVLQCSIDNLGNYKVNHFEATVF